ncbi:lantibiotic dehydratase [Streptomyces adustus]|uniref:lantibiotic dehydratase n=1 Tax=Streptomyces adustus TaxID=1609272 RepID=UPI00371A6193
MTGPAASAAAWRTWLEQVWQEADFAAAVTAASPDLGRQVAQVCAGRVPPEPVLRRTVLSVMRYLLRARTRATPFGLFAGVAAARIGPGPALRIGTRHRAVARPDAAWTASIVDRLLDHRQLHGRLMLLASSLIGERDGRMLLEHRGRSTRDGAFDHVEIRLTEPVRHVLDCACTPILWSDLTPQLAARFPAVAHTTLEDLVACLVRERFLITSLCPAMTVTDPHAGLVTHACSLSPSEAAPLLQAPRSAIDVRVDWDLVLPQAVAREAAAAATVLTRLAPRGALAGWSEWHGRFLERYGPRAAVCVLDAIEALGYPPGYLGSSAAAVAPPLPERDRRLIRLAHRAALQGHLEVALDDAAIEELATTDASQPVQPSTEVTARITAASLQAMRQGEFTLHVVGVARSAGTTTGRFLSILGDDDRRRMSGVYAGLPGVHQSALVAQISSAPLSARAENVARAPQATEWVISLGDYHGPGTRLIALSDLAVTADARQLHLISLSRRRPVHTLLLNAVDLGRHSHPLARFLAEAPAALAVPCHGFLWGTAASSLPFLPALRHGRTILSPARWLLARDDLPAPAVPWPQWDAAFARWRRDVRLPERVYLSEADQRLALDLPEPSHRALLRAHLDRHATVTLHPAPALRELGWSGGRAHEVVIPVAREQNLPPVWAGARIASRTHGHLPGHGNRIYLQLHGHRDRQTPLLTRHLPPLLEELGEVSWWFVRYHHPNDHLRLRLTCPSPSFNAAVEQIGAWSRRLQQAGLITHTSIETYYPETGRFGGPAAISAAERYFAADSAAALAQLNVQTQTRTLDARALTAASMVDIATGLLGDDTLAAHWLIDHTRTHHLPPPRTVHRQAVDLTNAGPRAVDKQLATTWAARRTALAAYRHALNQAACDPSDLLADLLHLHHVRMQGPGLPEERIHLHLARAAALSRIARTEGTP